MSVKFKDENGVLQNGAGLYKVTAPIGMADIYSTEEKEVGLWIDGKPLYQKTVNCGTLPNNTTKTVAHGISNIDTIVNAYGNAKATANQTPIPFVNNTSVGSQIALFADATNITLRTSEDKSPYTGYVTLQYTKTTDTPWSGKFVPQGYGYVSSGDIYSFEERQVGVWADGKPLYQKTLQLADISSGANVQVDVSSLNIDEVVNFSGVCKDGGSNTRQITFAHTVDNKYNTFCRLNSGNKLAVYAGASGDTITGVMVTIQYTKTTDVAGSGEYVPSGDKAEHYSTDEEVIGTFLGKTLYRKVFNFSTPLVVSAQQWATTDIPTSSLNVETLVNSVCICDSAIYPCAVSCDTNDTYVSILSVRTVTVTVKTLIIEYTKTS